MMTGRLIRGWVCLTLLLTGTELYAQAPQAPETQALETQALETQKQEIQEPEIYVPTASVPEPTPPETSLPETNRREASGRETVTPERTATPAQRVNLQTTVTGNQEQPRVLYILPWQSPPPGELDFELLEGRAAAVFEHLERSELRRQIESAGELD